MENDAMKECPFCAEQILAQAKKCKHCGETIDVILRAAEQKASTGPNVFMNAATASTASSKSGFPHLLHVVLCVLTAGFWFPFWVLLWLFRNRERYY